MAASKIGAVRDQRANRAAAKAARVGRPNLSSRIAPRLGSTRSGFGTGAKSGTAAGGG